MALHIYRVVVRGYFADLDDDARATLRASADAHDIFESAFTESGTLTYTSDLYAFNTRFALRATGDPAENEAEVTAVALEHTERLLADFGVTGKGLGNRPMQVIITDMADMWSG
ncbi:MAG: hypothetical protein JJE52_11640 [Acidimicrobiia bacterium]|nr:hypothetical protein [Acidimicrobiia bacterium]